MTVYYNEIDLYAAKWLRALIAAGHIADGVVDTRSIEDVHPDDLDGFTQCHFFAGIGVWSRALRRAGWPDDRPVWTGSCPCQPFSAAGKGAGFADERHLWPAWHHLISECKPAIVFGEQVASADAGAWLDLVQDDMEALGHAFGAVPFPSAGVGAPHIRDRLYWVADATGRIRPDQCLSDGSPGQHVSDELGTSGRNGLRHRAPRNCATSTGDAHSPGLRSSMERPNPTNGLWRDADWLLCRDGKWRPVEPGTFPLAHGAPARVGRLRAYGNAIVEPAAHAWIRCVMESIG